MRPVSATPWLNRDAARGHAMSKRASEIKQHHKRQRALHLSLNASPIAPSSGHFASTWHSGASGVSKAHNHGCHGAAEAIATP